MNCRQSFFYVFFAISFTCSGSFTFAEDSLQVQLQQEIDVLKAFKPDIVAQRQFDDLLDNPLIAYHSGTILLFVGAELCQNNIEIFHGKFPGLDSIYRPEYIADLDHDGQQEILCLPAFLNEEDDMMELWVLKRQGNEVEKFYREVNFDGLVALRTTLENTTEIVVYHWDSTMIGFPEIHDVWSVEWLAEGVYAFTGKEIQERSPVHVIHEEILPSQEEQRQFTQSVLQELQAVLSESASLSPQDKDTETLRSLLYSHKQFDVLRLWMHNHTMFLIRAIEQCQQDMKRLQEKFPALFQIYHPIFIGDLTRDGIPEIVLDLSHTRSRTTTLVVLQPTEMQINWYEKEIVCPNGIISVEKSSHKIIVTCVASQRKAPIVWKGECVAIERTEEMTLQFTDEGIKEIQPFQPSYEVIRRIK